jgi:hypothetical protein
MPKFICPVKTCKYWSRKKEDCKKEFVNLECRSDDYDITLACPYQDTKEREKEER